MQMQAPFLRYRLSAPDESGAVASDHCCFRLSKRQRSERPALPVPVPMQNSESRSVAPLEASAFGRLRSRSAAPAAPDRDARNVAIGLVRSGAGRLTNAIVRSGQAARFRLGDRSRSRREASHLERDRVVTDPSDRESSHPRTVAEALLLAVSRAPATACWTPAIHRHVHSLARKAVSSSAAAVALGIGR
jgi:hypothetical protein